MNHTNILKRSWHILWAYRALWVFGFILALTTGSAGSPGSNANTGVQFREDNQSSQSEFFGGRFQENFDQLGQKVEELVERGWTPELQHTLIVAGIILVVVIILLTVIFTFLRYISEAALIKMVDDYEESGEKRSVREGFRMGWSREAWRMFLIDLVISLPLVIVFGAVIAGLIVLMFVGFSNGNTPGIIGGVAGIGFMFLLIFIGVLVGLVLQVLTRYFYRACALDGYGVFDSIRVGFRLARDHFKDTGIMALIMLGINIAWPIVMIPVFILVFLGSLLLGGGTAAAVGGLTGVFAPNPDMSAWVWTIGTGLFVFITAMSLPMSFFRGLKLTYQSSAWTLAYREVRASEVLGHVGNEPAEA